MATTRESKRILSVSEKLAERNAQANKLRKVLAPAIGSPYRVHEATEKARKDSKRILSVTVKREFDYDADTSELGEYSDTPNDYAIVNENARGEYGGQFVRDLPCECGHSEAEHANTGATYRKYDNECNVDECFCEEFDQVTIERGREYRYYNPPIENYIGIDDEEMRKYCLQDYERMRGLIRDDWGYVSVKAVAKVALVDTGGMFLTQTITSGGLWGIESDSGDDYFAEVEGEQLDELRTQLHAIGFSKRAVSAAMRNVERKDY